MINRDPSPMPETTRADLLALVERLQWRKTKYIAAHAYIIRTHDRESWDKLARAIDQYGYWSLFYGQRCKYLNLGEYRYWHYQVVLNRAHFDDIPQDSNQ